MYTIQVTPQFKRDVAKCKRQGRNIKDLWDVVGILQQDGKVPDSYNPHTLHDEYAGCWECHIEEDWLLIWKQNDKKLTLLLTNTGTHKDLFG